MNTLVPYLFTRKSAWSGKINTMVIAMTQDKGLLAPLGREPAVCAECLFADPVADIAVLGSPDNQALFEQADAYRHWSNPRAR